jgi:hypothetical protein
MRQILRISFVIGAIGIAYPALGQHELVCFGTDRVLIGSSSVFQMEDCRPYQITGISVNGNLMFATPFGAADYLGHRFRVYETGRYANGHYGNADVTLQKVISNVSGGVVNWSGVLTPTGVQPIGQCYAALEWYYQGSEGCRFSAAVVILGTVNPGVPVSVALSTGIDLRPGENGGTYAFHLWSGEHEIKLREMEGPES